MIRAKLVLEGKAVAYATATGMDDKTPHIRGDEQVIRALHDMLDHDVAVGGAMPKAPRIIEVMRQHLWDETYAAPDEQNYVEFEGWTPPAPGPKAPPGTVF